MVIWNIKMLFSGIINYVLIFICFKDFLFLTIPERLFTFKQLCYMVNLRWRKKISKAANCQIITKAYSFLSENGAYLFIFRQLFNSELHMKPLKWSITSLEESANPSGYVKSLWFVCLFVFHFVLMDITGTV